MPAGVSAPGWPMSCCTCSACRLLGRGVCQLPGVVGLSRMERAGISERRSVFVAFVALCWCCSAVPRWSICACIASACNCRIRPAAFPAPWWAICWPAPSALRATLFLLALFGIGFSLLTGASWLVIMEQIGAGVEWAYTCIRSRIDNWRDRKAGEVAKIEREESVQVLKKHLVEDHEPIRIERPVMEIPNRPGFKRKSRFPCSPTCRIRPCRRCIC